MVAISSFALMFAWSLAVPPYSAPDEPSHVIRAVSVVRGQLVGRTAYGSSNPFMQVYVPQVFSEWYTQTSCYRFKPTVPASCVPKTITSSRIVSAQTYTGRYPPLYYLIVGLPSLLANSMVGLYLMRMLSAILSASMIGLAVYSIKRWSSKVMLPLGIMLAATPMVLYLGGMINPNGLEISSSICLWVSGLILFTEHRHDLPRGLLLITCLSASILILMRGLSPLWALMILAAVMSLGSWAETWKLFLSRRDIRLAACILFIIGAIAATWVIADHSLDLVTAGAQVSNNESSLNILLASFRSAVSWFPQMIGVFGSLDTRAPAWAIDIWFAAVGAILVIGLLLAKMRQRIVLLATITLGVIIAVLLQYKQARQVGLVWQGRYMLPLFVGVPIMSIAILDCTIKKVKYRRIVGLLLTLSLGVAGIASTLQALRRYAVGATGSFTLAHKWRPPGGFTVIISLSVIATIVFVAILLAISWRQSTFSRLHYRVNKMCDSR